MPSYVTRTGDTLVWSGENICLCTQCEVLFATEADFDAHLIRRRPRGRPPKNFDPTRGVADHVYRGMEKNGRGHYVRP